MTVTEAAPTNRGVGNRGRVFPKAAALLLVLVAAFPMRLPYGFAVFGSFTLLDVGLVALGFSLGLRLLAAHNPIRNGDGKIALLLAVPFLICILSLAWSDDPASTFRQIGIFSEAVVAYWVAVNVFASLPATTIFRYLALFAILLLLGSALSLAQVPGFGPPTVGLEEGSRERITYLTAYYGRLGHPFYGLHNDYASVLSLFVLPLLAWAIVRNSVFYFMLSACTFAAVVMTLSRGVIAATVLGGLVFLVSERRRVLRWLPHIAVGSALVIGVGYVYYQINETVQSNLVDRLRVTTIDVRRQILSAGLEWLSDAPLLGYGGGVVPGGDRILAEGVHNTYLQQMLYYGIPLGLLATAALWLVAFVLIRWPARSRTVARVAVAIGGTMLVQLVQFLGETSFEATLPKTALYLFIGVYVVVLRNLNRDADWRRKQVPEVPMTDARVLQD